MPNDPRDVSPSLVELARAATAELRAASGADGTTFVISSAGECHYLEENCVSALWKGQRFPSSICISGWVMRNRSSAVIEDISADPRIPYNIYRSTFVRSLIMAPLGEVPFGAMGMYWAHPYGGTAETLTRVEALLDRITAAARPLV